MASSSFSFILQGITWGSHWWLSDWSAHQAPHSRSDASVKSLTVGGGGLILLTASQQVIVCQNFRSEIAGAASFSLVVISALMICRGMTCCCSPLVCSLAVGTAMIAKLACPRIWRHSLRVTSSLPIKWQIYIFV